MFIEEHQPDIARKEEFTRAVHDVHLPAQLREIHAGRFVSQAALGVAQVRIDERALQITDRC
jgi:hypothetical protein